MLTIPLTLTLATITLGRQRQIRRIALLDIILAGTIPETITVPSALALALAAITLGQQRQLRTIFHADVIQAGTILKAVVVLIAVSVPITLARKA